MMDLPFSNVINHLQAVPLCMTSRNVSLFANLLIFSINNDPRYTIDYYRLCLWLNLPWPSGLKFTFNQTNVEIIYKTSIQFNSQKSLCQY